MLVVQRKRNEGITITLGGVRVNVLVVGLKDGKVKLGVDAPEQVKVHRDEVQSRVDEETRNA